MSVKTITSKQFREKLGNCSAPTFYRYRKADSNFPQPINFGGADLWLESEADDYILTKPRGSTVRPAPHVKKASAA